MFGIGFPSAWPCQVGFAAHNQSAKDQLLMGLKCLIDVLKSAVQFLSVHYQLCALLHQGAAWSSFAMIKQILDILLSFEPQMIEAPIKREA